MLRAAAHGNRTMTESHEKGKRSGVFKTEKDKEKVQLTVVRGVSFQDKKLVAQHLKLDLDIRAILLREELGEFGLNLGLLIKQLLDGGVQGRVIWGGDNKSRRRRWLSIAFRSLCWRRRRLRRNGLADHGRGGHLVRTGADSGFCCGLCVFKVTRIRRGFSTELRPGRRSVRAFATISRQLGTVQLHSASFIKPSGGAAASLTHQPAPTDHSVHQQIEAAPVRNMAENNSAANGELQGRCGCITGSLSSWRSGKRLADGRWRTADEMAMAMANRTQQAHEAHRLEVADQLKFAQQNSTAGEALASRRTKSGAPSALGEKYCDLCKGCWGTWTVEWIALASKVGVTDSDASGKWGWKDRSTTS